MHPPSKTKSTKTPPSVVLLFSKFSACDMTLKHIVWNVDLTIVPIEFSSVRIEEAIVPTKGIGGSTVYCGCNVFSGWKTEITVSCPKVVLPLNTLVQIISTTGKYIGIGTQRANGYGRYHIANATIIGGWYVEYQRYTKPENGYNRKPKNISVKNKTIKWTTAFLFCMPLITERSNPCTSK